MPSAECELSRDELLAREIAEFIAERAFDFWNHECRAWALSDFKAWALIAGLEPVLTFRHLIRTEECGSSGN
jgi:hypothetical protein